MNVGDGDILLTREDVLLGYKSRTSGILALSKYNKWFPIRASSELAGVCADLMGDGHIQPDPKLRIDYTSKSEEELLRFNYVIFKLFGIRGKIRPCKTNKYGTMNLGINNKPLARCLSELGVPTGAKVFKKFSIPAWIKTHDNYFSRFMNRLFSCEGCVDVSSKCIEIKMYKSREIIKDGVHFFVEIKEELNKFFGIKTTNPFLGGLSIRKDGRKTQGIRLKIKNKDSLIIFRKFIGFDDKTKRKKLNEILDN